MQHRTVVIAQVLATAAARSGLPTAMRKNLHVLAVQVRDALGHGRRREEAYNDRHQRSLHSFSYWWLRPQPSQRRGVRRMQKRSRAAGDRRMTPKQMSVRDGDRL